MSIVALTLRAVAIQQKGQLLFQVIPRYALSKARTCCGVARTAVSPVPPGHLQRERYAVASPHGCTRSVGGDKKRPIE